MNGCLNEETLQAWIDGELSPADVANSQAHAAGCANCTEKARAARQALALADGGWESSLPEAIPAARLRARLDGALAPPLRTTGVWGALKNPPQWTFAAVALILAIALTVVLNDRLQDTPPVGPLKAVSPVPEQNTTELVAAAPVTPKFENPTDLPRKLAPNPRPTAARSANPVRRSTADAETARHLEKAQHLLRSIRNAEAESVDWAYDLQLSRELLSRNRLLRHRAATRNDTRAERVLLQVEPVLLDIANLAEPPAPEEIAWLKAMIQEHHIMPELQRFAARAGL